MLGLTQLRLLCYHSDRYFPPCTRRLQCAWLCMLFCNPLVTWLVSSVKQFVSFMSCFRSFRLRAKAFSRRSILFLEKAECPARKERHSGCFSMRITHSGTCLDPAEEVPPSLSQCCVWDWLGNGSCMVLGGGCKYLWLDGPAGAGKQGLGKHFYHLYSSQGPAARLLKGQGIKDGCLRSIACISHSVIMEKCSCSSISFYTRV